MMNSDVIYNSTYLCSALKPYARVSDRQDGLIHILHMQKINFYPLLHCVLWNPPHA